MIEENFFEQIKNNLSNQEIIDFMKKLGVINYIDKEDYIIFPTICHNINISEASLKLYYYKSNKLFHCYTDCGESFNIWGLIKRYSNTRNLKIDWKYYIALLCKNININKTYGINFEQYKYETILSNYSQKKNNELKVIPSHILSVFVKYYTYEWLNEGILPQTMDKYNILFSITQNKIIIPHYDENNNLVGIRGRALNDEDIELGKYRPVCIEGKMYNHPLSLNLYGLNLNKKNISSKRTAIVFEGEKSVLLMDKYYPCNISVAACGSNFHKSQLNLLLKYNVNEIILAYDKENIDSNSEEKYFNKLWNICNKYKNYCNFSFIFDRFNLLDAKNSPIDKGQKVFETLLSQRVKL